MTSLPPANARRILVVGELILDRYLWGTVERLSPEAPIPILQITRREQRPGNAAFVCASLAALGARPSVLSVVGRDPEGHALRQMLEQFGVAIQSVVEDPNRSTTVKERMLGAVQSAQRGVQQLLRVDHEDARPLGPALEAELLGRLEPELDEAEGVLICDINKGLLSAGLLSAIIAGARRRAKPVIIDPRQCDDFSIYRGATMLTPNRYETERATGLRLERPEAWSAAARKLIAELELAGCLVTLDREGMFLAEHNGHITHIDTRPREVYDVTGAGDVVLAVFGLYLIEGLAPAQAAVWANLAAGLEVARQGAAVISREELAEAVQGAHHGSGRKVVTVSELQGHLQRERQAGRRIGFTNGCFDLLHAGHIQILEFARAQGDLLVVGLNSDASVRQIKGEGRPVYPVADRARILAGLEAVDYVVVFDEPRAVNIIEAVRPDVLIKGEDWRNKVVDGADFVESYGGQVVLAQLLEGRATTQTIQKLRDQAGRA